MKKEELREQCRRGVRRALAKRGWELVKDEAAFIEEVLAEVQFRIQNSHRPLEKIIEDATINRYGYLWHAACGANGTLRQRQAFTELHRYLYSIALYRANHDPYLAEESTQEALISVWRHLDQVKDPGSFARWAGRIVSNKVSKQLEKLTRKVVEDESGEVTWQPKEIPVADLGVYRGVEDAGTAMRRIGNRPELSTNQGPKMTEEMRARIEAALRRCLPGKQQRAVIIGLFLDQKSFKEVADALGTTPQNVSVLKSRALKRLRECEDFLEVMEDLT
jgi:RNA polymerase sigma factor (sigma-70 family)